MFSGCTDLSVMPYSEIGIDDYYRDATQVEAAVFTPYAYMRGQFGLQGNSYWRSAEMSSDQLAWPQKGRHGYDGGDHGRQHYHSWTTSVSDNIPWNAWAGLYRMIGYCNQLLYDFETRVDWDAVSGNLSGDRATLFGRELFTNELRALRAWFHIKTADMYGNIPIVTDVDQKDPKQSSRADVFDWVEAELLEVLPKLLDLNVKSGMRITKETVYAILVEMYLNSEVWTGESRWDDCIRYADMLLSSRSGLNGTLELDADIDVTYGNQNKTLSKEILWYIAGDQGVNQWIDLSDLTSYAYRDMFNTPSVDGYNGIICQPGTIQKYNPKDLRRYSWFLYGIGNGYGPYTRATVNPMGPHINIGTRVSDKYALGTEEYTGLPLIYLDKPMKSVIEVTGTRPEGWKTGDTDPVVITIKEWHCPEFPDDEAKLLVQDAYNSEPTKTTLYTRWKGNSRGEAGKESVTDADDFDVVYNAGSLYSLNRGDAKQYTWSDRNDYRFMFDDCAENSGARFNKYKIGQQGIDPNHGDNGFIIYRLTEIYYAKAEALMRKNGGSATAEAVELVNTVKRRAFLTDDWNSATAEMEDIRYTTSTLTLDELLDERGREFIFEGKRRNDLIRFGKYEFGLAGWWDADDSVYPNGSSGSINRDQSRRLYPIPGRAMENNPNLVQNPGYN